jgi:DNA-binding PadR family transcriptional regulator
MEGRGWIRGRWVEKAGQRRRRYYSITPTGRTVVEAQRQNWAEFVRAVGKIAEPGHA